MSSHYYHSLSPRLGVPPSYENPPLPLPENEPNTRRPLHENPEFRSLATEHQRLGTTSTAVAVGGFLLYVLLSSFTPGLMNQLLVGRLTLGLAIGLGQFAVMTAVAWRYTHVMGTRIDPAADRLRAQLQQQRQSDEQPADRPRPRAPRTW